MEKCSLIFIIFILLGCQTSPPIKANLDLINGYTEETQKQEPFDAPYVSTYSKGNKTLKFIAADHENAVDSETFKTVKSVIENFKPEIMILEGFSGEGISPKSQLDRAYECEKESYQTCGEDTYAVILGQPLGIPFITGEPTDQIIHQELLKKSFTTVDLVGFYIVRYIPQWRRQGILEKQNLERKIERVGRWIQKERLNVEFNYSWDTFRTWYKEKLGKRFAASEITTEEVSPRTDNNPTFLNKISHEVGVVRERNLVTKIEQMLNSHNRVLVLYGGGHLVKQRAVLREMMSEPKNEKVF